MKKITTQDFKENNGLILVTIILAFLQMTGDAIKPSYYSPATAMVIVLIGWPLVSLWFMAFWNRILTKIFELKRISYGVAFVLMGFASLFF